MRIGALLMLFLAAGPVLTAGQRVGPDVLRMTAEARSNYTFQFGFLADACAEESIDAYPSPEFCFGYVRGIDELAHSLNPDEPPYCAPDEVSYQVMMAAVADYARANPETLRTSEELPATYVIRALSVAWPCETDSVVVER